MGRNGILKKKDIPQEKFPDHFLKKIYKEGCNLQKKNKNFPM